MINTLTGTIVEEDCGDTFITLRVHSIGFQVFVRSTVLSAKYPDANVRMRKFYIHENIAVAQQGPSKYDLYGFETTEERELFRAMLKYCDRVGPSTAMKAMNIAPPEQLLQAIRMGNVKYLERGVGEKTANAIILGLGKYAANAAVVQTRELV